MHKDQRHQLSVPAVLLVSLGLLLLIFATASNGTAPAARAEPIESVLLSPLIADLSVAMSAEPAVAAPGDGVFYRIDYQNLGPDSSGGVTLTSPVPIGLIDVGYLSSGAQVTPTGAPSYTWRIAPLGFGQGGVITVTGTADPALAGSEEDLICEAIIETESYDPEAGNDSDQATVVVDGVAPEPPVLQSPLDGTLTNDNRPTLVWNASPDPDTAGYEVSWNGGVYGVGDVTSYQFIAPVADGVATWSVRAYDEVGNTGSFTDTWSLRVDATPPAVLSHRPPNLSDGIPLAEPVIITFTEPIDVATLDVALAPDPGSTPPTWNPAGTVATLDHAGFEAWTTYTVTVEAADDLAGNALEGRPVSWHFTTMRHTLYLPLVLEGTSS
jgi:uncharacterized repeat protein (TIGR01451 family)